jgi:hypothetical protein
VAKVGTSNQGRTISLKAAVRSCINNYNNKVMIKNTKYSLRTQLFISPGNQLRVSAKMYIWRYMSEGCEFDSRLHHWNISLA